MAAARQYTPARRMMMQAVMWLILGATVAVAAIITSHRRNQFEVKLTRTLTNRGLTVQLPNWRITPSSDPLSPVLFTAVEESKDKEVSPRVIHVERELFGGAITPLDYLLRTQVVGKEVDLKEGADQEDLHFADSPGIVMSMIVSQVVTSDQGTQAQVQLGKLVVAAAIPTSGRGIAVTLEGEGPPESEDVELIKHIAQTIKLADEPHLSNDKQLSLGEGIQINLPGGYAMVENHDPLRTSRRLQSTDPNEWRSIELVPVVLSDKDGAEAISTMLSLYDSDFAGDEPHHDADGVWEVELQSPQNTRAYAIAKDGQGVIAIFKGSKDADWIGGAWQDLSGSIHWPASNSVSSLIAAGTEQAKKITDGGLAKLRPGDPAEQWWLNCLGSVNKPLGWVHFEPAPNGGRVETRIRLPKRWYQDDVYGWRGSLDLKTSYRANDDVTISPRLTGTSESDQQKHSFNATLSKGKLAISTRGGQGGDRDLTYYLPANYVQGGWLPDIMAALSDKSEIVRADSFFDVASAQSTDLLTIILRPLPPTSRPTTEGESASTLKAVSVEVSGSGERSIWYIRPDRTVDSVDYAEQIHLIRRNQDDISMDFRHEKEMQPQ